MREGILVVGIILLVLGILLYFMGNNAIQDVEAYDVEGIPISELLKTLSSSARNQYQAGQSMVMFGSIFGIVGFMICIAGIATPSKKHESVVVKQEPKEDSKSERRCPGCGRVIHDDDRMCPYCGKKFTSFSGTPASNIYQKVKDFKDGESSNQDYLILDEKESEKNEQNKEEVDKETEEKEIKKERFCFECGAKLEDSPKFCTSCGVKLR